VCHALTLNKIMYAISAWYGFLNNSHVLQINSNFKRAFKYGYHVESVYNLQQFLQDYDVNLFTVDITNHILDIILVLLIFPGKLTTQLTVNSLIY